MKSFLTILFILAVFPVWAQQTFNKLNVKELNLPSETASKILYLDASKNVKSSTVTPSDVEGIAGIVNAGSLPIIKPTLLLDFANSKTLDPRVTFERPSIRTCINAFGLIVSLATNEPCFDHDPDTLESKGLLIEESRTNLLTYSNDFADSAWSKSGLTVIQNATTAPDGSLTASKLVVSNGQSLSGTLLHQTITKSPSPITYTLSVFAKADGLNRIQLILNDSTNGSNYGSVTFSLIDGNLVGTAGAFGDFTSASASSKHYGNGVYRVWLTVTTNSSTGLRARITPRDSVITTGDGSLGLYIWGAQLEVGSFPTSTIKTEGAPVTRSADLASMTGTNFSSWYRQDEGTFVSKFSTNAQASNRIWEVNDGTSNNRISHFNSSIGQINTVMTASGVSQLTVIQNSYTLGSISISGLTYKLNTVKQSLNGSAPVTDLSASLPTVDRLYLGQFHGAGGFLNGHIYDFKYYPKLFSDATTQAVAK